MDGVILKIAIVLAVFIIKQIVMDFKYKNFIPEVNYNILSFVMYGIIIINAGSDFIYDSYVLIFGLATIIAIFIILRKNKFYYFKGIDKKVVKENENEIIDIINKYKKSNLDNESEISLISNRIIFENVKKTQVEECLSLIGSYLDKNRKKYTVKDYLTHYGKTIVLPSVITISVIFMIFKILSYDPPILDAQQINIIDEFTIGNTEGNINNYGLAAETDESIYFIKDYMLFKSDKDLKNETLIVEQPINSGKDTINVVEEWIFFRQAKKIRRVQTDGTNIETIFNGYSLHMQVVGNWIYFISLSDDSKICRIDVNGQNKQFLSGKDIDDLAVYNGKIYYSYGNKDNVYLESMKTDGTSKQLLSNIKTRNMIVDEEYIYYLDDVEEILYRMNLIDNTKERLSNEPIQKFIKDESFIFYTIKAPDDSHWSFKGLYRMNSDGSNVLTLDSENYLDELGMGITDKYVFYVSTNGNTQPSLKIINKDGTSIN